MSSPCAKCKHLLKLDEPVFDPDYPRIAYYYGCGYAVVPPPMFSMQSGRSMLWSADGEVDENKKMLLISNIETSTSYAFEPRDPVIVSQ